jgi:hypothetical protein
MSVIRRASPDHGKWESRLSNLASGENGEITDIKIEEWSQPPELYDDYEYDDQGILIGEFKYHQSHPFQSDKKKDITVNFMYRNGSDLFILDTGRDDELDGEIIRKLNSKLSDNTEIYPGINTSRKNIWDFVRSAEDIGRVQVLKEGEVIDINEIELPEDEIEDLIIWDAELIFENPETGEQQVVIYSDESITLPGASLEEIEYILQMFEQKLIS